MRIALIAAAAALLLTGVAWAASVKITSKGVGDVKLGRTFRALRDDGLVGRLRPGCKLAPNTRQARLKAPLKGHVDFTLSSPRRANDVFIRGGAKARGVGVGDRASKIRRAFPRARFDHSTEDVFGITLVRIPKNGGGKMQFAVSTTTHRVTVIGVPFIAFCE